MSLVCGLQAEISIIVKIADLFACVSYYLPHGITHVVSFGEFLKKRLCLFNGCRQKMVCHVMKWNFV